MRLERASGANVSVYFACGPREGDVLATSLEVVVAAALGLALAGLEEVAFLWPGLLADLPAVPVCPGGWCGGLAGCAADAPAPVTRV